MTVLNLVPEDSQILREPIEDWDFDSPPTDGIKLAYDLAESMMVRSGLGLAAPQVGLPYRCFAIKTDPIKVCFNPRILEASEEEIYLEEGCLSFPDMFVKVKRPRRIRVRFRLPNGETITEQFEGLTARIFQHELDHLDGVLMMDRASYFHREQAARQRKGNRRKRIEKAQRGTIHRPM